MLKKRLWKIPLIGDTVIVGAISEVTNTLDLIGSALGFGDSYDQVNVLDPDEDIFQIRITTRMGGTFTKTATARPLSRFEIKGFIHETMGSLPTSLEDVLKKLTREDTVVWSNDFHQVTVERIGPTSLHTC